MAEHAFDEAAKQWESDAASLRNLDNVPVARDLEDFDIYKSVAEALVVWVRAMVADDMEGARKICEPFSQFPVVQRCLDMTSGRNL